MRKKSKEFVKRVISVGMAIAMVTTMLPVSRRIVTAAEKSNQLKNEYFDVEIGDYGEIKSLRIVGDEFPTNYVLNGENAPTQGASEEHQWMGELLFQTKKAGDSAWTESMTSASAKDSSARRISKEGNKVTVTYENETAEKGIKDFTLTETYELIGNQLRWSMKVSNPGSKALTIGDFGLPMTFNEYWSSQYPGELLYETRVLDHSFVGGDSSYIYAQRPSGQGKMLVFTPESSTGARLEYQDHWRVNNGHTGSVWAQDQGGWANGLNVFYIHSNVIKSTGSSYLENTELTLAPGESKEYAFNFTAAQDEAAMRTVLYNDEVMDITAVPSMAFSVNMPAKFYLHTNYSIGNIKNISIKCTHETNLYEDLEKSVSNKQECTKNVNTSVSFQETKIVDGEQYHIYNLSLSCLGVNHMVIDYTDSTGASRQTTAQFYAMDNAEDALNLHADFVTKYTQVDAPGKLYDMIFDDWMMDTESVRGVYSGYFGWGDDWGFTHGEYLAEKNVYLPVAEQIQAVDNYLDIAIWNGLMKEHQEDYLVNDWLDEEPNNTGQGTARGYAYPHVYNTYFSMYKVASKYPDMIEYAETKETYLQRCYNIMKALYSTGVGYNWDTGLMGESTTPDIIDALTKEGFYNEAQEIIDIMAKKYKNFSNQKYPYGSEYSYDNTGEEAVYVLAKLQNNLDMMQKIDLKTRACRGTQPIWYHYGVPTTICGENWWNFQYSASLIGYCMDDWLRLQNNQLNEEEIAYASRMNYAAKLANLTAINSGQIDASEKNVGTVAWTYQAEMGHAGGQGTGGGNLHNGWRQMAGEADTGLFGAMRILSADVANDPVFGLFGYGCEVSDDGLKYAVTPLDGLNTRLNFMNEGLYIELNKDQYMNAIVGKDKSSVELNVKNLEGSAHITDLELTGLAEGTYQVMVDESVTGSFRVDEVGSASGASITASIPMPAAASANVKIEVGEPLSNTAPIADAGEDMVISFSDRVRLEGSVKDDGYPDMTLNSMWEVLTKPDGADVAIDYENKLISSWSFNKTGTYTFKLTVSDGELTGEDTITITVLEDPALPETLAYYTFDNISEDVRNKGLRSADESDSGYASTQVSYPVLADGKDGKAISLKGTYSGYVRLSPKLSSRVEEATIALDLKLAAAQGNDARLFEFADSDGRRFYVSVVNGNELQMGITNCDSLEISTIRTSAKFGVGYWKNVEVTLKDNTAILYVEGIEKGRIEHCNFSFSDLSSEQRSFIGRGDDKAGIFFNGLIDNFTMKSKAMTAEELLKDYGFDGERTAVSAQADSIVTMAGVVPNLPNQVDVLYSDGSFSLGKVTWDILREEDFAAKGTVTVNGQVEGITEKIALIIHVVEGEPMNIASLAEPSAIIDSVNDLGGAAGLNDGYMPENSKDTSHGVWHNWNGNQGGSAWVQYDWSGEVILTSAAAYYFKDGGGNFKPANITYEYKDVNGSWKQFSNVTGLEAKEDCFNVTTFQPVTATGLRMIMTPEALGCGVIEWQVYGYTDQNVVTKMALREAIQLAEGIKEELIQENYSALTPLIAEAKAAEADSSVTQEKVNAAEKAIYGAISKLVPKDDNLAYTAGVSTSYISSWEKLTAVNDGIAGANSAAAGIPHYGTWGNESAYETVTYTWGFDVLLNASNIYFWNDGGGILTPASYSYEYMGDSGEWVKIEDAKELVPELDKYNKSKFSDIKTKALRVTINKEIADGQGIGLIEWQTIGKVVKSEPAWDGPNYVKPAESEVKVENTANGTKLTVEKAETKVVDGKAEVKVEIGKKTLETVAKAKAENISLVLGKNALESAFTDKTVVKDVKLNLTIPLVSGAKVENIILTNDVLLLAKESGSKLTVNIINGAEQEYTIHIPLSELKKVTNKKGDLNVIVRTAKTEEAENGELGFVAIGTEGTQAVGINVYVPIDKIIGIKAGEKVYVYWKNAKTGKLEEIPNNRRTISVIGEIKLSILSGGKYVICNSKQADAVKLTDKVKVSVNSSVTAGNKLSVKTTLPKELSLTTSFHKNDPLGQEEVKVSYAVSNKEIAVISKKGILTAKKKGTVKISITVILENGQKRIVIKNVKVK